MKPAILVSLVILAVGLGGLWLVIHQDLSQKQAQLQTISAKLAQLPTEVEVPVFTGTARDIQQLATISATAALVIDKETGAQLYANNSAEPRYPASTVKMMTAIVARQIYPLDRLLTVREEAFADGSTIGFQIGEQLTVRDLLAILLIHSGNDAAFVLANNAPGGYNHFVELMNLQAKELGLTSTHFVNSSGLDDPEQQTSAEDLAKIGARLLEDPLLAQFVRTKYLTVSDASGRISHPLVNRDELLGVVPGVIGIKTGTTEAAGENLVTAVQAGNRQTILVLLGSSQRYPEMTQLMRWVNSHYSWKTVRPPAE